MIADRFSFCANDTFVASLRKVVPTERLSDCGERPERGSSTAGHILLPNSKMSVPSGTFASFNVDGERFEMDFERPDVRMVLPIDSYFVRARWYLENALQDIATH